MSDATTAPLTTDTSLTAIDSTTVAGSQAAPLDLSVMGLFMQADWVVKGIILLLVFMSIYCWALIFAKYRAIKSAQIKGKQFEKEFWASNALDKLYDRVKHRITHPTVAVFVTAMDEWFRSKPNGGAVATTPASLRSGIRDRVNQAMLVTRNREIDLMERGLSFLATTGSSAPFIGLFGTVWGIMNSFSSIAASKNTSLVAVAPGIAEALFATAVGLFAAIPAVIFYNKLSNQVTRYAGQLEDFSMEFGIILSRQLENG